MTLTRQNRAYERDTMTQTTTPGEQEHARIQAPDRLYALLIKLRPLEHGTLMPFTGEFVHAAWLHWLRSVAPDVAALLHDGNQRRLFTCSSLSFPLPWQKLHEAERNNTHLPLDTQKVYTIRLTLLLSELFPLLYSSLLDINRTGEKARNQSFLSLSKQEFLLEEVISSPDDVSRWTGYVSFRELVERSAMLRLPREAKLELEFATLTTFHRGSAQSPHGKHYVMLPLPEYVFPWLAKRWQALAPPELAEVIQPERINRYIAEEGIVITDHALSTHQVHFSRHPQYGFLGTCTYSLRGPDEPSTGPGQFNVRQQLILLSHLAFYTGVGYKTTMGLGQVRMR